MSEGPDPSGKVDLQRKPGCLGRFLQLLAGRDWSEPSGKSFTPGRDEGPWPYRRKKHLLSQAEFSFFRVLQQVAAEGINGQHVVVCPKVNLNDLLYLAKGTQQRQSWLNKINRKHADFVLCDAETMTPAAVVELDDASHESAKAQQRDATKDRALEAAGLPLIRIKAQRGYQVEEIRKFLKAGSLSLN